MKFDTEIKTSIHLLIWKCAWKLTLYNSHKYSTEHFKQNIAIMFKEFFSFIHDLFVTHESLYIWKDNKYVFVEVLITFLDVTLQS